MLRPPPEKPKKTVNPATLKRVITTFSAYRPHLIGIFVLVMASAALGILSPFFLKALINQGLLENDLGVITHYSLLTLVATLGSMLLGLGFGFLSLWVGQQIMRDLRNRLNEHLQGMSLRFFTGTRTGEIQSRLVSDVGGVQNVLSNTVSDVLSNVAVVLSTLVAMIFMDWRLTLLSVGMLPLFALLAAKVGDFARGLRKTSQEQLADLNATTQETLSVSGVLLTKTSGRRARVIEHFSRENDALTATEIRLAMIMRVFFNMIGLTFSLTPIFVYWLAGYLIIGLKDATLTLGTIVAFTRAANALVLPADQPAQRASRSHVGARFVRPYF